MSNEVAETLLKRDRFIVLSGLALIVALSWAYVSSLASDMQNMDMGMAIPPGARPAFWLALPEGGRKVGLSLS